MSHTLPIHCIYASTSGNVELVVEQVGNVLKDKGFEVHLHRAEQTPLSVIADNQTFILATSTWEHGVINPFFRELHDQMKKANFAGKRAAFIGLGDRRYEPVLFCEGMEKVRKTWLANQGQEMLQPLRMQGEPYALLDTLVTPWAHKLVSDLNTTSAQRSLFNSVRRWLSHD